LTENDFQKLILHCHHLAEKLLLDQDGEFYPFGATINNEGELIHNAHDSGDEFPLSRTKINDLKKYFTKAIDDKNIKAYAIAFDCLVRKDSESDKTDAIAIECYSRENGQRTIYYYPYKRLAADKLGFGKPWGMMSE
jgi:hypothetical protein